MEKRDNGTTRDLVANVITTIVAAMAVTFMTWRMATPSAPTYQDVMKAQSSRH